MRAREAPEAVRCDLTRWIRAATLRPATAPREAPDSEDNTPRVTASELAFLGLGLLLGAATGAAILVTLGSRPRQREIRVTVTRDALPRRSETLSQDAFVTSPAEPARGGPGDRRWFDRADDGPVDTEPRRAPVGVFPSPTPRHAGHRPATPEPATSRTIVPFVAASVGVAILPEADAELDAMRLRVPGQRTALERMLRGEHRAMVEVVDRIAGEDSRRRRDWELLLGGLVEAMADLAVGESVIDFPMGTAFWDAFTVEQCRRIVAALSSMGYRYDGRSGWLEGRVPAYRDLAQALADIEVDPRRVRAWPNQSEIAALFVGARPAPEELLPAAGPDYAADDMRELLGERAAELANLWLAWEAVRPALFEEPPLPDEGAVAAETRPAVEPG